MDIRVPYLDANIKYDVSAKEDSDFSSAAIATQGFAAKRRSPAASG
jgi:hypothetical protein